MIVMMTGAVVFCQFAQCFIHSVAWSLHHHIFQLCAIMICVTVHAVARLSVQFVLCWPTCLFHLHMLSQPTQ